MPQEEHASLAEVVRSTSANPDLQTLTSINADVLLKAIVDHPMSEMFPVFREATLGLKVIYSIRDSLFLAKFKTFFESIDPSNESREKWRKRVNHSPKECKRVVNALLLTIEQADDLKKVQLYAMLVNAFTDKIINAEELSRLSQGIGMCFVDDVLTFVNADNEPIQSKKPWMASLQRANFTKSGGTSIDTATDVDIFDTATLGQLLRKAHLHVTTSPSKSAHPKEGNVSIE